MRSHRLKCGAITVLNILFVVYSQFYQFIFELPFIYGFLHWLSLHIILAIISAGYFHTLVFSHCISYKCPTVSFVHSSNVVLTTSTTTEVRYTFILIIFATAYLSFTLYFIVLLYR